MVLASAGCILTHSMLAVDLPVHRHHFSHRGFVWCRVHVSETRQTPLDVKMLKEFGLLDDVYYQDQMLKLLTREMAR